MSAKSRVRSGRLASLIRPLAPLLTAVAILLAPCLASAQSPGPLTNEERAQLEVQKQTLFQQMLSNPANLDAAFAYADVSARLGDNEAAVSTLERMLLFNPALPRVDLELGVLYFRMGSFDIAQSYFNKALESNPPADVRSRVDQYLTQIRTQNAPQQLTGYLMVGMQYQSDANVAPGSPLVHSPIGDILLSSQFVKKEDENIFITGAALYTYDLGNQDRDQIEISGIGFANQYFRVHNLNLDLGEVTAGVRFNFPDPWPGIKTASLKPYVILNEVGLGGNQYFNTYGVGLEHTVTVLDDIAVRSSFEFRQKNFSDAPDRPASRGLNGNDKFITILATKPVTSNSELRVEFDFLDQDTRFAYYTNKAYAGSLGYRIRYDDPTGLFQFPWETTFSVSRTYDNYAAPDPCCNTSTNPAIVSGSDRYDRRWRFGVSNVLQVTDNIGVAVQYQRDIVSSNLSLYGYTSNTVLVGPQIRF